VHLGGGPDDRNVKKAIAGYLQVGSRSRHPEKLRRLQFVRFDTGPGFARPLSDLAAALRIDLQWIREHTRLGEIATRWYMRRRPESLLLRAGEIEAAKT
jgi:hypothetical protein